MGLLAQLQVPSFVHAPVERIVFVQATESYVVSRLRSYSPLFESGRSTKHRLDMASAGEWTAMRLPDGVHPWQLHDLASWMRDCARACEHVIAWSAAAPHHPAYRLVPDPELPDALCGWDDEGRGWTVQVASNDVVCPEPVPVPRSPKFPSGFHSWRAVRVRLADIGGQMNPFNEPTFRSREHLRERHGLLAF